MKRVFVLLLVAMISLQSMEKPVSSRPKVPYILPHLPGPIWKKIGSYLISLNEFFYMVRAFHADEHLRALVKTEEGDRFVWKKRLLSRKKKRKRIVSRCKLLEWYGEGNFLEPQIKAGEHFKILSREERDISALSIMKNGWLEEMRFIRAYRLNVLLPCYCKTKAACGCSAIDSGDTYRKILVTHLWEGKKLMYPLLLSVCRDPRDLIIQVSGRFIPKERRFITGVSPFEQGVYRYVDNAIDEGMTHDLLLKMRENNVINEEIFGDQKHIFHLLLQIFPDELFTSQLTGDEIRGKYRKGFQLLLSHGVDPYHKDAQGKGLDQYSAYEEFKDLFENVPKKGEG